MWQYVESLLRQRRPRPFRATQQDAAELRTAILLRSAQPGISVPTEEFVDALHQRLATELAEAAADQPRGNRRRFVQAASIAAAAAAVGAAADQVLVRGGAGGGSGAAPTAESDRTLRPNSGEWRSVVASKDLPEGGVQPFDLGAVVGFVQRSGGQLSAVSGVCTHLGCRLTLDASNRQLNCPCHRAAFAVSGAVLYHQLSIALPSLPQVLVRDSDGAVQVFVPSDNA